MRNGILISIAIVLLFSIVFSQEPQEKKGTLYDKLLSKEESARIDAYNAILAERRKTEELLLKIAKEAEEVVPYLCSDVIPYMRAYSDPKSLSILLLAKYPSKSVVNFLLDNIHCGQALGESIGGWDEIFKGNQPPPAVRSLIEIGMPSVKAILERLEQKDLFEEEKTVKKRVKVITIPLKGPEPEPYFAEVEVTKKDLHRVYGYVIREVLGPELGVECLILEYKKAQRTGQEQKMKNIEKILKYGFYGSQKVREFLEEINKQREQEKQKQKQ